MSGIAPPTYTQTPNEILDEYLPLMGEAELKVVLSIVRNTFGWHRKAHKMSLSYFVIATGLSRQGVVDGLNAGMERGIICRHKSGQSYEYSLRVKDPDQVDQQTSQASRPVDRPASQASRLVDQQTSQASRPELVKQVDPTNKDKERTTKQTTGGGGSESADIPDDVSFGEVAKVYQNEIGLYSVVIADMMAEDYRTYGGQWIIDAIKVAVAANKRKYNYVRGVLRRWHTEGRQDEQTKQQQDTAPVVVRISGGDM